MILLPSFLCDKTWKNELSFNQQYLRIYGPFIVYGEG